MGFWYAFWLFIASTAISIAMQKTPRDASKASDGEFQVPTAEEGRAIPVVFGTCYSKAPNVVWWGNLQAEAIKKKAGGFLGLGAKKYTQGWKYRATLVMAICQGPIDAILDIVVGEKSVKTLPPPIVILPGEGLTPALPRNAEASGTDFFIGAEEFFGGELREGGIRGTLSFYYGNDTQPVDDVVNDAWGGAGPAWRGITYCVWKGKDPWRPTIPGGYLGNSPYIKNWAFAVRRCPTPAGFDAAKSNINGDANPAHMIFEILTDTTWGIGITPARSNLASFTSAASTLYSEGFGMSIMLDAETSADDAIADILRTIDGVLYTDPATGLWTLKLARADYDPASLLEFTTDDLVEAPEWSRGLWSETVNEVRIEYVDRSQAFTKRIVQAQETANFATQGMTSASTLQFYGVSNATLANKIAIRELKTLSYPLAKFRIRVNRKGWALRPGSVFKLTWNPPSGTAFSGMVLRVTSIRYGALEAGEIEIDAVEDIFSVASTAYPVPDASGWSDPATAPPVAVIASKLWEVPYHLVGEERWCMATGVRGDDVSFVAEIWTDEGTGYFRSGELESFTPSGVLAADYSAKTAALDSVGFTLAADGKDLQRLVEASTDTNGRTRGDNLAIFEDTGEIVSWTTATDNGDGTFNFSGVLRGVLDTVPTDHGAGSRVWFVSEGAATTKDVAYPADLTVKAKLLPTNPRGTLALASATEIQLATSSRAWKPYPAGNVKLNALGYGSWPSTIVGDAALTWDHRNRVSQGIGGLMVDQDTAGAFALEGNYTIEVLVGGVVKQTFTAETGTSRTYNAAQRIADDPDGTKSVSFRIKPINGSYTGTTRTTPAVVMTGFGMQFGQFFGGIQA